MSDSRPVSSPSRWTRRRIIGLAVLLLVAAGIAWWALRPATAPGNAGGGRPGAGGRPNMAAAMANMAVPVRVAAHVEALITQGKHHPLAGIVLQRQLESRAYTLGGSSYDAPGQRVGDFAFQGLFDLAQPVGFGGFGKSGTEGEDVVCHGAGFRAFRGVL